MCETTGKSPQPISVLKLTPSNSRGVNQRDTDKYGFCNPEKYPCGFFLTSQIL